MGGFTRPIAEAGGDLIGKLYSKMSESSGGRFGIDMLWSMSRSFQDSPTGETVYKMTEQGLKAKSDHTNALLQPVHNFYGEVKKDPSLALAHDYKTAPLAQIHGSLPYNHPAKTALDPLMATAKYHTEALPEIESMAHAEGNAYGRDAAFGKDGRNLAATIYPMLTGSPTDRTKGEAWLGILSQVFKDTEPSPTGGKRSAIKNDVQESINRLHKGLKMDPININRDPEYKGSNVPERFAHKYAMDYLAPFIALAHVADFYKFGTVPAQALYKTLTSMNDPQIKQLKAASGIFFHTFHSIMDNDFRYRTGTLAKLTGKPDAAALIHKMYHQPLFNNERMILLSTMGSAAYHSAQMWGKQAVHGNARALAELAEMHLDSKAIVARGGDLTDEELTQAIWHYTNNRLFIDKPMDRTVYSQKSPIFRVASMFHGYITKEGKFLTRELNKLMLTNDYKGLAQFAGTIGVVFPATAPLLLSLQTLVRTASPATAGQTLTDEYHNFTHPDGFEDFGLEYLKLLGHIGTAGAFMQYVHAADNHKTAAALIGPVPGVLAGTADDLVTGLKGTKKGEHNWRPLERDVLRYFTLPIFGNWAAQHMIPKGTLTSGKGIRMPSFTRRERRY